MITMNTITLLLFGILFICIGFVFGFMIGFMINVDRKTKEDKE